MPLRDPAQKEGRRPLAAAVETIEKREKVFSTRETKPPQRRGSE
jgi:hypothetical protein